MKNNSYVGKRPVERLPKFMTPAEEYAWDLMHDVPAMEDIYEDAFRKNCLSYALQVVEEKPEEIETPEDMLLFGAEFFQSVQERDYMLPILP